MHSHTLQPVGAVAAVEQLMPSCLLLPAAARMDWIDPAILRALQACVHIDCWCVRGCIRLPVGV